ncbi:hypothetical protein [Vibrio lentus]|uniref:hypothetical protein n=1 Tax=Vibrio lentus TaxID=136468 RepID=UPI00178D04EA|nr:hypothetical protein [Vibrio lentus]MDN3630544.1 hypothetical protein [Vibrio lentus]
MLIITVRHPVDFLDSYYKEVVTNGWDFECAKPKAFLKENMSLVSYEKKFEKYDENFGVNNVIKVIYGDELFKLGVERVFSNILGVKYHEVMGGLVNKSSSVQYVNYVRRINNTLFNVNRMRCILNSVEDKSRTNGNNGYVFSSDLVDFIVDGFELGNKNLSKYEFHTGNVKEVLGSPSKLSVNTVDINLEYFDPSLAYEDISRIDVLKYLYRKSPIKFRKLMLRCYFRLKR